MLELATSAAFSVSERIWMVDAAPVPTFCASAAGRPSALAKESFANCSVMTPWVPLAGIWICVPPVKSMPRLNPRNVIDAMQTSTSTPKTMYQRLRAPTMSNAPVPV